MPKILALDTSSEACSVALWLDGEVREDFRLLPRQHTRLLLPMVDQLLVDAGLNLTQLDAIAFGRGPGSFTGLRIATGVAQGLALGGDLPLLPVSTLAALAQAAHRQAGAERVLAAIDARMDEVYWGAYGVQDGVLVALAEERVTPPEGVALPNDAGAWVGYGTGWAYSERFAALPRERLAAVDSTALPAAGDMARLAAVDWAAGRAVAVEAALPVYLRDKVALKKADQGR